MSEPEAPRAATHGSLRAVRAALLGGTSIWLALTAHLLGGGALPGPAVLVVAAGLIGLVALTCTARRCRFPLVLAVLGVEQLALHLVFEATSTPAACVAGGGHAAMATCTPGGAMGHDSGPGMLAAHLVATVVTAWWLARGEAWVWGLARSAVAAATAAPHAILEPLAAPGWSAPAQLALGRQPFAIGARGPPLAGLL